MLLTRPAVTPAIESGGRLAPSDYVTLFALLLFALSLRVIFFTGFYGSDEVTYILAARDIQEGIWDRSNYIGSIRYGINIPVAAFLSIFGLSEFSANLWSLVTSLAEVALVYFAAAQMWGRRPALIAGLLVAVLPLHVNYAGRILADAPLAFFVSSCFVTVWMAEKTGNLKLYLIAGLAAGGIYWVKDAVFYLTVTLLGAYLVAAARWHSRWVWMALGALAMVLLNCLLMWKVFDDPFHLIAVSFNSLTRANTVAAILKRPPEFYFTYLLFDIKHVFLIFYLALGGIFLAFRRHNLRQIAKTPEGFVALWALGFLGLLSLLSLKQVNYILIFAAPMALLSAYFVSFWRRGVQLALLSLVVAICFVLAAFEQQAIHAFTANSRASVSFAEEHPEAAVFAATGAIRAQILSKTMGLSPEERSPIQSLTDLDVLLERQGKAGAGYGQQPSVSQEAFAIMDPQTAGWGDAGDSHWEQRLRSACLMKIGELRPALLGAGRYVVDGLMAAISLLPEPLASKFSSKLADSLRPKTAAIYRIGAPCAGSAS